MTPDVQEACDKVCMILGYAPWEDLATQFRGEVMQLVLLMIIAEQLEKIANPLITVDGEPT